MENLTAAGIARHFDRLAALLAYRWLPCSDGTKRAADASEFMLMFADDWAASFKHRDSRNYVEIRVDIDGDDYLNVPTTSAPFLRGTFDVFPEADAGALAAASRGAGRS